MAQDSISQLARPKILRFFRKSFKCPKIPELNLKKSINCLQHLTLLICHNWIDCIIFAGSVAQVSQRRNWRSAPDERIKSLEGWTATSVTGLDPENGRFNSGEYIWNQVIFLENDGWIHLFDGYSCVFFYCLLYFWVWGVVYWNGDGGWNILSRTKWCCFATLKNERTKKWKCVQIKLKLNLTFIREWILKNVANLTGARVRHHKQTNIQKLKIKTWSQNVPNINLELPWVHARGRNAAAAGKSLRSFKGAEEHSCNIISSHML